MRCWFPDGNMCRSSCSTCGTVCAVRFPLVVAHDAAAFKGRGCTVLAGGLLLRGMARNLDEEALMVFENVTTIAGPLVIAENDYLVSLMFLSKLRQASSISITSNSALVDARLPSLDANLRQVIRFQDNDRTCWMQSPINGPSSLPSPSPLALPRAVLDAEGVPCAVTDLFVVVDTDCPEKSPFILDILSQELEIDIDLVGLHPYTTGLSPSPLLLPHTLPPLLPNLILVISWISRFQCSQQFEIDDIDIELSHIQFFISNVSPSSRLKQRVISLGESGFLNASFTALFSQCKKLAVEMQPPPMYVPSQGGFNDGVQLSGYYFSAIDAVFFSSFPPQCQCCVCI
jgi:hypothetical protein